MTLLLSDNRVLVPVLVLVLLASAAAGNISVTPQGSGKISWVLSVEIAAVGFGYDVGDFLLFKLAA
jgi:hypothetical protein